MSLPESIEGRTAPGCASLRRLGSAPEIRAFDPSDPFLRWEIPASYAGPAYALGRALIFARMTHTRRPGMAVIGPPDEVADLIDTMIMSGLLAELPRANITIDEGSFPVVADRIELGPGGDWHWMWTESAPDVADPDGVVELGEADYPELRDLLAEHNPGTDGDPGGLPGQTWLGIRDPATGRLIACGVAEPNIAGYPLLSGITVHAEHRGLGLGRIVTAALTRHAVAEHGVCTLGVYAANEVAQNLYRRLGFQTGRRWRSRRLKLPA